MSSWSEAPSGPSRSIYPPPPGRHSSSWMSAGDDGHQQQVVAGYSNWATQPYSASKTASSSAFSYDPATLSADPYVAMTTDQHHHQEQFGPAGDGETSTGAVVFGFDPVETVCRLCDRRIVTQTTHVRGQAARFFCLFVASMGILMPLICLFCLCLIPLYSKSCQDVLHSCPHCKQPLHVVQRPLKNRSRQPCPKSGCYC